MQPLELTFDMAVNEELALVYCVTTEPKWAKTQNAEDAEMHSLRVLSALWDSKSGNLRICKTLR
jgi:hypothetical protein